MRKLVRAGFVILISIFMLVTSEFATADQERTITISSPRSNQHISVLPIEFRLGFGISSEQSSFQANLNGKTVTDKFQLTNSTGKSFLSIVDGVRPGRNTFQVTVNNRSGTRFRATRSFVLEVPSAPQLSGTVSTQGGSIILPEIGSVSFPSASFASDQNVTLSITTDSRTDATYQESAQVFGALARVPYELRISIGRVQPRQSFNVRFTIPSTLRKLITKDTKIALFGKNTWKNSLETHETFELFAGLDSSDESVIESVLPNYLFSNEGSSNGAFETVITLGIVSSAATSSESFPLAAESCPLPDLKLFPPVIPTIITSKFGLRDDPKNPSEIKFHSGIDYKTNHGSVYAMADGVVEHAGVGPSGLNGGYGYFIILRHDDGSSSLYGHLVNGSATRKVGERVSGGTVIAISDNTGKSTGPHLHVEYYPVASLGRINLADCIKISDPTVTLFVKWKVTCNGTASCWNQCAAWQEWAKTKKKQVVAVDQKANGYYINFTDHDIRYPNVYPPIWYSRYTTTYSCNGTFQTQESRTNKEFKVDPFATYCVDLSVQVSNSLPCPGQFPACKNPKGVFVLTHQYSNFRSCGGSGPEMSVKELWTAKSAISCRLGRVPSSRAGGPRRVAGTILSE